MAELKVELEESEDKFYDMGFIDVKNLSELVMYQSRRYGFNKGWMAAVNAMGVLEESPFKIPKQIPYPEAPSPLVQNLNRVEEEESQSMKELVAENDSHVELIDLKISNDLDAK